MPRGVSTPSPESWLMRMRSTISILQEIRLPIFPETARAHRPFHFFTFLAMRKILASAGVIVASVLPIASFADFSLPSGVTEQMASGSTSIGTGIATVVPQIISANGTLIVVGIALSLFISLIWGLVNKAGAR